MTIEPIVINNTEKSRFEMNFDDGNVAFIDYRMIPGKISLVHTEVPAALSGKGVAAALAKYALDFSRANNLRVFIYCAYIAAYVKRHPDYNDIIDHTLE